jgi:hypothetical protein
LKDVLDYWISGLCPSSGFLNSRKHNVLPKGPNRVGASFPSPDDGGDLISEKLCFLMFRIPDDAQNKRQDDE